jgi:hypothetical protein
MVIVHGSRLKPRRKISPGIASRCRPTRPSIIRHQSSGINHQASIIRHQTSYQASETSTVPPPLPTCAPDCSSMHDADCDLRSSPLAPAPPSSTRPTRDPRRCRPHFSCCAHRPMVLDGPLRLMLLSPTTVSAVRSPFDALSRLPAVHDPLRMLLSVSCCARRMLIHLASPSLVPLRLVFSVPPIRFHAILMRRKKRQVPPPGLFLGI